MSKMMAVILSLALVLGLAGCGKENAANTGSVTPPARTGKLKVVSTIAMIGDTVKRIGGEHVDAQVLLGPGTDPHLYKASEADARLLYSADVVFYNGLSLEGKMGDLLVKQARMKSAAGNKAAVFAVTEEIDPKLLREPPEMEGHYDPHVWFDVSLWAKAAEQIRDGLSLADPAHQADFKKNADAVLKEFTDLHDWCKKELATVPKEQRVLVTAHDAFGYFGRAYDVEVHGIQGISTEDQAPVSAVNALVDLLVSRKVKAVFVESSVPRKNIEALIEGCKSRGHAVAIGGELFSDAMGEAGTPDGTYPGMVKHNVNTIVKALK